MKFATFAAAILFAGCLGAQTTESSQTTTTTTTSVNYTGTLVDQSCYTSHTKRTESSSDGATTTTTETKSYSNNCPATASTTSFGLVTPEGKFVRFDDAGNTRVVEMMKTNKDWRSDVDERKPVHVRIVGSPNGDYFVVREIR
jgi:hypothetical protein